MIPESMLVSNPTIGKLAKELAERKICRICLSESGQLVDYFNGHKWNTILRTCFAISKVIAERLPKFVCETCGKFLEMCWEFRRLCKRTELMMVSYPLTEKWPDKFEVPSWLRSVPKRQVPQEDVPAKKPRASSVETTDVVQNDQTKSEIGTIRVRTNESLVQSPTISSEMQIQFSAEHVIPNSQTVIQYCQNQPAQNSYPTTQPYPQYKPSHAHVAQNQQPTPGYPLLQQQLQQPSSLPPPINSRQYLSSSFTHQVPYYPPQQQRQPQQPQQQPPQKQQQQQPQQYQQQQQYSQQQPQFVTLQPIQPVLPQQPPSKQPTTAAIPKKPTYRPTQPTAMPPQPTLPTTGFPCTICSFVFNSQSHLVHHFRKHLGNGEYNCGCGERFYQMGAFVAHLKQHTEVLRCGLCGDQFASSLDLAGHLDQHAAVGLLEACDFCPLAFVDQPSRLQHVGWKHSDDVRKLMELNPSRVPQ